MIDDARALLRQVDVELERLVKLKFALMGFIEQPASSVAGEDAPVASDGEVADARAAASPIQSADGGDESAAAAESRPPSVPPGRPASATDQPGSSRSGESRRGRQGTATTSSGEVGTAAPVSQPSADPVVAEQSGVTAPVSGSADPSTASFTCECGHVAKNANGLKIHRGRVGHPPPEPWIPKAVNTEAAKPDHPSRSSWLCGRCPGKFSTEEKLRAHYDATGHDKTAPPAPPVRGIGGLVAGMGQ